MEKCRACGAPIENGNCSYCGATAPSIQASHSDQNAAVSPKYQAIPLVTQIVNVVNKPDASPTSSDKNKWVAFLLCLFLGVVGVHRFYVGKIGTGLLYLLTAGGLGFGVLIDLIVLVMGNFKDKQGRYLR